MLVRLVDLYSFVVIAAVLISWLGLPPDHPLVRVSQNLTEPLLAPIRKILPSLSGLDFSPLILLLLLQFLKRMLGSI